MSKKLLFLMVVRCLFRGDNCAGCLPVETSRDASTNSDSQLYNRSPPMPINPDVTEYDQCYSDATTLTFVMNGDYQSCLNSAPIFTMQFNEVNFLDRFVRSKRAGFKAVEYMFPYDWSKDQLVEALESNGLTQVLHNLPAGNWAAGERGIACLPGREGEFQDGVGLAIEYAKALRCPALNCLVGLTPQDKADNETQQTLVANLKFAAGALEKEGIKLLVESLNDLDIPGFHLCELRTPSIC